MKVYTVGFIAKKNPDEVTTPDDAYVGDDINRAKEQAEEFRHNLKRFADFVDKYNVAVWDKTGHIFYQQPFVKVQEPPANEDKGARREKWEGEEKKS